MSLAEHVMAWVVFGNSPDKGAFAPVKRTGLKVRKYKPKKEK